MIDRISEWLFGMTVDVLYDMLREVFYTMVASSANMLDTGATGAAGQVAQSPMQWLGGAPGAIVQSLAETVIPPIAGIILAYIMCWELLQLITDRNNHEEFDINSVFVFIIKLVVAVFLATNAWPIAMGMFDVAGWLVNAAAVHTSAVTIPSMGDIRGALEDAEISALLALILPIGIVNLSSRIMPIIVSIIVWGRTIEILIVASAAPIPLATLMQRDMSGMGQNYLKYLAALGFQGFLIMVCFAIHAAVFRSLLPAVGGTLTVDDITSWGWSMFAVTLLLCFMLFQTKAISKSIFSAH